MILTALVEPCLGNLSIDSGLSVQFDNEEVQALEHYIPCQSRSFSAALAII